MADVKTFNVAVPEHLTRAVKVSGGALPKDFSAIVPLTVDFRGCSGAELSGWAMSSLVIRWQGPARGLTPEFLRKLAKEGITAHARACGSQMKSPEERIAELVGMGVAPELAALIVANPEAAMKAQAQLSVKK